MTGVLDEKLLHAPGVRRPPGTVIRVLNPGLSATVQDLGRPGYAHLGVTRSGAADRSSLKLGNRLVGNVEGAAGLESTLGGLSIALSSDRWVAVTGAPAAVRVDGRPVMEATRLRLQAGQVLSLDRPRIGLRTYVAVQGGLAAPLTLDSGSTDTLSGLGPRPLAVGDEIAVYEPPKTGLPDVSTDLAVPRIPGPLIDVTFRWGPRDALFPARDRATLVATSWTVSSLCDRTGARLTGPAMTIGSQNIPSEGMALGAIQVPPSGQPIIFLADHPVTGGYPVIGVVTERDVDLLAQAPPGTRVRLSAIPAGGA